MHSSTSTWRMLCGVKNQSGENNWCFSAVPNQFYEWFSPSVRTYVRMCLSVCPSHFFQYVPSSYHHEIFGSHYHWQGDAKGQGQRSKVKITEVKTLFSRCRTVIPVWIDRWLWNDAQSFKKHRRSALLFFKFIRQSSNSNGTKMTAFYLN